MIKTATLSPCRTYRYVLRRIWRMRGPACVFVGLNPSTADETQDDPTIRRCMGFAEAWGFSGMAMVNLFAVRATDPRDMLSHPEPVGPDNDMWLRETCTGSTVIAVWGTRGDHLGRSGSVAHAIPGLWCLGFTKAGCPKHPLYLPKDTKPVPYSSLDARQWNRTCQPNPE
ncbi:MAG: DUF1643 domain-containing protein [Lentisphaerae bacterium]|nr:DUF1643 domain-containing protein [Lentisphaerota bacterium]MBT7056697.1 DUF1643 domain-containing protein [Lentisphaerota bacterium]